MHTHRGRRLTRVPPILMYQVRQLRVLHEQVVLLTIVTDDAATVAPDKRLEVKAAEESFYRVLAHYGFMEQPNVEEIMKRLVATGMLKRPIDDTVYFLGRETILGKTSGKMGAFAESLFSYLQRNAVAGRPTIWHPTE